MPAAPIWPCRSSAGQPLNGYSQTVPPWRRGARSTWKCVAWSALLPGPSTVLNGPHAALRRAPRKRAACSSGRRTTSTTCIVCEFEGGNVERVAKCMFRQFRRAVARATDIGRRLRDGLQVRAEIALRRRRDNLRCEPRRRLRHGAVHQCVRLDRHATAEHLHAHRVRHGTAADIRLGGTILKRDPECLQALAAGHFLDRHLQCRRLCGAWIGRRGWLDLFSRRRFQLLPRGCFQLLPPVPPAEVARWQASRQAARLDCSASFSGCAGSSGLGSGTGTSMPFCGTPFSVACAFSSGIGALSGSVGGLGERARSQGSRHPKGNQCRGDFPHLHRLVNDARQDWLRDTDCLERLPQAPIASNPSSSQSPSMGMPNRYLAVRWLVRSRAAVTASVHSAAS